MDRLAGRHTPNTVVLTWAGALKLRLLRLARDVGLREWQRWLGALPSLSWKLLRKKPTSRERTGRPTQNDTHIKVWLIQRLEFCWIILRGQTLLFVSSLFRLKIYHWVTQCLGLCSKPSRLGRPQTSRYFILYPHLLPCGRMRLNCVSYIN